MDLYFIGGASGSGKTAILSSLRGILDEDIKVYDFDDIGVPVDADKQWRQAATEKWLEKLVKAGSDACLLGQMVLGEILSCPSAKKLKSIHFCLLEVSDHERIKRLKKRNTYGANQDMLNWASWLRMHLYEPTWELHVIKEDAWEGLDFSIWDKRETWPEKVHLKWIDTTDLSIKSAAEKVALWIQEKTNEQ